MSASLAELWQARAGNLPLQCPEEALFLASMVEKETGVDSERPLVASVFVNRLRKGMPLQSDPTVVYGITSGEAPLGRALTRADLADPTPRSEEHTSELQSLMRISYAVFCLKKKKSTIKNLQTKTHNTK